MKKEHRFTLPTVGIASLIVIFGVLFMTVFALLAVTTAQSELRLAKSTRQAIDHYYAADFAAEEQLARLRQGEIPQGVTQNGEVYTYHCPISETQTLLVQVEVHGQEYIIHEWCVVSTAKWQPDSNVPVWGGDVPNKED